MQNHAVIIDDDIDDIELMIDALQTVEPSLQLVTFLDGVSAISWLTNLNTIRPVFIFIDMNMPIIKGDYVLLELRKYFRNEDTKIVMYSTSMPNEVARKLIQLGAHSAFEKPSRFEKYISILTDLLKN